MATDDILESPKPLNSLDNTAKLDMAEAWIMAHNGHRIGSASAADPDFKVVHRFTPGLYVRELHLPAGSLNVSKIHKTQHPYVLTEGEVMVYGSMDGPQHLTAGHIGITKIGSRRLVYAVKDSVWVTFHPTTLTDVDEIEKELIEEYTNPLLGAGPYDPHQFRELTKRVVAAEKVGFWSDWTPEQQQFYEADDWEAFSRSRGYSEEEIADYGLWRKLVIAGTAQGYKPLNEVADIIQKAIDKNTLLDVRGEIGKSSLKRDWMELL